MLEEDFCEGLGLSIRSWPKRGLGSKLNIVQKSDGSLSVLQDIRLKTKFIDVLLNATSTTSCNFRGVLKPDDLWKVRAEHALADGKPDLIYLEFSAERLRSRLQASSTPEVIFDIVSRYKSIGLGIRLGYDFNLKTLSHIGAAVYLESGLHKVFGNLQLAKSSLRMYYLYAPDQDFTLCTELTYNSHSTLFSFLASKKLSENRLLKLKLSSSGLISGTLRHNMTSTSAIVTAFGLQARNVSALQPYDLSFGVRLDFSQF